LGLVETTPPLSQQKPQSPLGQLIAGLWSEVLGRNDISRSDNFFDLGGDSLKSATFMAELEEKITTPLGVGALFDHPTVDDFEAFILASIDEEKRKAVQKSAFLPEPVFDQIAGFMSAWPGKRLTPYSLVVGQNTLGARPALFWGCQDQNELTGLARHMGPDQPVYGFRSLYKTGQKSDMNSQLAASHYVHEILQIQPKGPYFIAGYCEAGKLAFEIAEQLTRQGHDIQLLILVEQFVPRPYAGRIALFFCPQGHHSPYRYYQHPEMGWGKYYSGPISLVNMPIDHLDFFQEPFIDRFSALLNEELQLAHQDLPSHRSLPDMTGRKILEPYAYRASLVGDAPRALVPGAQLEIVVQLTNTSEISWPDYNTSGIALASRWRRRGSGKVKIWKDGFAALASDLSPGQSCRMPVRVEVPEKAGAWILEIDLTDQGVCWFQDKGSTALKLAIRVSKLASIWQRLHRTKINHNAKES
jgi:oxalate---CoA ligase